MCFIRAATARLTQKLSSLTLVGFTTLRKWYRASLDFIFKGICKAHKKFCSKIFDWDRYIRTSERQLSIQHIVSRPSRVPAVLRAAFQPFKFFALFELFSHVADWIPRTRTLWGAASARGSQQNTFAWLQPGTSLRRRSLIVALACVLWLGRPSMIF